MRYISLNFFSKKYLHARQNVSNMKLLLFCSSLIGSVRIPTYVWECLGTSIFFAIVNNTRTVQNAFVIFNITQKYIWHIFHGNIFQKILTCVTEVFKHETFMVSFKPNRVREFPPKKPQGGHWAPSGAQPARNLPEICQKFKTYKSLFLFKNKWFFNTF